MISLRFPFNVLMFMFDGHNDYTKCLCTLYIVFTECFLFQTIMQGVIRRFVSVMC